MSKPIKILLEFTGWQRAIVDTDGDCIRPANAHEVARIIASDIEQRFAESMGAGKMKVTVKQLP